VEAVAAVVMEVEEYYVKNGVVLFDLRL